MTERAHAWDDMVMVGTVARPQGLRGHVYLNATTDFVDERFKAGAVVWTRIDGQVQSLRVSSLRIQSGRPIVTFDGCDDVEQAQDLAGLELRVPEETLQPLPEDVYYHHQLVGCTVTTADGVRVGEVQKVEEGAGGNLLSVQGGSGEVLIPLAREICVAIDVARRQIQIVPPAGLIELNESTQRAR